MRVLFLSTWFPYPADNGSKIRAYHLLKALGERHTVSLLSFAFGTANAESASGALDFCEEVVAVDRNPFVRSRAANAARYFSPVPIVTRPVGEMTRAGRSLWAESYYEVVVASTEVMATYALQAPRAVTRVLEEHNSMTRWNWERYREQESALQRFRCWVSWQKTRYYEARLFRQFDLCTMVSEEDRTTSLRALPGYRGRVEVVPNGVDCRHNVLGMADPKADILIYNGSLTYGANYDAMRYFLDEIMPLVRACKPGASVTVTGSTAGVDLKGLRLGESVRFSGYVDDIRPLVAGAQLCVVPIRQGGGTRLKILEAMALGTPVVSTSKGAEGLEVTHGRDILIADEPGEFAAQVVRVLRDQDLHDGLATEARRTVEERYDWEQIGRGFVDLIEEVAGAAGGEGRGA